MSFANKKIFQGYDWMLPAASISLAILGLLSLFSITQPELTNFYRQLVWLFLGVGIFFMFASVDYRLLKVHFSPVLFLYFLGVAGVIAVYFLGVQIRGARSWISLGPVNIEPVEALKIILILILAKYFSARHVEIYRIKHIFISGLYVLLPAAFILIQPDLGSFAILVAIWVGVMIVAGIKIKHLAILALIAAVLFTFAWSFFLQDYQKDRLLTFVDSGRDPHGAGYNSIQAQIAVGSGGLWGKGFAQGTQAQFGFLPEAHTDFIFASLVEEFGAIAALATLLLYGVLFWRLMHISKYASDNFARLTIIGISVMLIVQLALNIAMTLGIMPITGLPLPFVSYGGSSLITLFLALGVCESIYRHSTLRSIGTE